MLELELQLGRKIVYINGGTKDVENKTGTILYKRGPEIFWGEILATEFIRPCLVGRKFSVFSIQTFRKQGKHV